MVAPVASVAFSRRSHNLTSIPDAFADSYFNYGGINTVSYFF